jgi:endonuclease/exonuclease/phosphatase family metal-dependent hydrolase
MMRRFSSISIGLFSVIMVCFLFGCQRDQRQGMILGDVGQDDWVAPDGMIRVVTYNLGNYVLMDRDRDGQEDDPKPEDEIEAMMGLLKQLQPDVLAVQEMGIDSPSFQDFRKRLAAQGLNYPYADLGQGSDPIRHVAVVSRFPLEKVSDHADEVFRLSGETLRVSRGVQELIVKVNPDYSFRLINLHLKSKRAHPLGEQEIRNAEARIVREVVEKALSANPEENLLVVGDFNDTKNTTPLEIIRGDNVQGAKLSDVWARDDRRETWTQNWRYQDIYSRFDFALYSSGMRPEIVERGCYLPAFGELVWRASDHRPVVVGIIPEEGAALAE